MLVPMERIVAHVIHRMDGCWRSLITIYPPSNWKGSMPRLNANHAIRTMCSKEHRRIVIRVTKRTTNIAVQMGQIAPLAITRPVGRMPVLITAVFRFRVDMPISTAKNAIRTVPSLRFLQTASAAMPIRGFMPALSAKRVKAAIQYQRGHLQDLICSTPSREQMKVGAASIMVALPAVNVIRPRCAKRPVLPAMRGIILKAEGMIS